MPKLSLEIPAAFHFETSIPVRITDINYGGHLGNDAFLSIVHEARMQFLKRNGLSELDFAGIGLIMRDAGIEFRDELFYGDIVIASVTATEFSRASFEIYYKLEKETEGKRILVALAKTGMIGYDYSRKKIAALPEEAVNKLRK
jgi:acyl-CoA thioester hydrolase